MSESFDFGLELIHQACHNFSPDEAAKRSFTHTRHEMGAAGFSSEVIAAQLALRLVEGIMFHRWQKDWPAS